MVAANNSLGLPLATALDRSEPLGGLMQRVRASKARLAAIGHLLPGTLSSSVRPGPLDESHWVLLVDNAALAAKLRQCLPELEAGLRAAGLAGPPIKIKVLPRG